MHTHTLLEPHETCLLIEFNPKKNPLGWNEAFMKIVDRRMCLRVGVGPRNGRESWSSRRTLKRVRYRLHTRRTYEFSSFIYSSCNLILVLDSPVSELSPCVWLPGGKSIWLSFSLQTKLRHLGGKRSVLRPLCIYSTYTYTWPTHTHMLYLTIKDFSTLELAHERHFFSLFLVYLHCCKTIGTPKQTVINYE